MSAVILKDAKVGSRVWFTGEKQPYKVRARNERYLICTKPFNPKRTVLYSIVDLEDGVRGPDNMIFSAGYESDEDVAARMDELETGFISVSRRRDAVLSVDRVAA